MNERNTADIIEAIVADHRKATRRVRARLALADAEARAKAEASAHMDLRRPGAILRSAKDSVAADDQDAGHREGRDERQRPARWLS